VDSENKKDELNPVEEISDELPERPSGGREDLPDREAADESQHKAGYKRPPLYMRFKPGQSGNPKGRPRGAGNLRTYVLKEWKEKIVVREGQRTRRISKGEAFVKRTFGKALGGDARATDQMLKLLDKVGHLDIADSGGDQAHSADDEQALELLKEQMRRQLEAERNDNEDPKEGKS